MLTLYRSPARLHYAFFAVRGFTCKYRRPQVLPCANTAVRSTFSLAAFSRAF
jgi:hypothetical protein